MKKKPGPPALIEIERALSPARLQPYIAARGNLARGVELYGLNMELCRALYPTLNTFEVVLRNTVHETLSGVYGNQWYSTGAFRLRQREQEDVQTALGRLRYLGKRRSPGRVVAELNLGFWTSLFNRHYEVNFWIPHKETLFPYASSADRVRHRVHGNLTAVRDLRNRVFHYEPVWNEPTLAHTHARAHEVISWVSPDVGDWIAEIDEFATVIAQL